jgi:hypothetical protein
MSISSGERFSSVREAKEYLAARIVEEAERQELVLSEVEQKMLFFSETGWTLPDMAEVNEEFAKGYDGDEYEGTITGLVALLEARLRAGDAGELEEWNAAVEKLATEDHYLSVLIRPAKRRMLLPENVSPTLIFTVAAALAALVMWVYFKLNIFN